MIRLRVARNRAIGGVVATVVVVGIVAGVRGLESQTSSTSAPAGASTTVGGASSGASAPSSASITTVTDPTTTIVTTTAPPATVAPATTAAPPATVAPAYSCSSAGSGGGKAPVVTGVSNPQPQQYAPSGDFQISGTNLDNVSMELLCPAGSTSGPPIVISQGPFSFDGSELNLHVSGGLVSGGIYDVRIVANGAISAVNAGDRLFVAIAAGGSASA